MNRYIEFRCYCEKYDNKMQFSENYESMGEYFGSNPFCQEITHMESTGLADKGGVKIFEGDIYHNGDINIKYIVIFKGGQFIGKQKGNESLACLEYWLEKTEVIGNIFENPELLR